VANRRKIKQRELKIVAGWESSKLQTSSTREVPNSKIQIADIWVLIGRSARHLPSSNQLRRNLGFGASLVLGAWDLVFQTATGSSFTTQSYPFSSKSNANCLSPVRTIRPSTSTCTKSGTI